MNRTLILRSHWLSHPASVKSLSEGYLGNVLAEVAQEIS